MKSVPVNTQAFEAAGLIYEHGEGAPDAVFTMPKMDPEDEDEKAAKIRVRVVEGTLRFFPERSSSQRALLKLLGVAF